MEYNLSQLQAINAKEDNILIKAPPGSGKTSCIVGAVEKYIEEHPTDKVAVITFTRKATEELRNRISLSVIKISTIHSWSLSHLSELGAKYEFDYSLLSDDTIKEILKRLSILRGYKTLNQFQLFSYVMGNYNIDVDERILASFKTIDNDYEKFKRKNQLYDFKDLPLYLLDKLNEYDEYILDVDALFVDEFQDVDPIQVEVFNRVCAKKKVYIADPLQSIYQFRGAVEDVIENLDGFAQYQLDTNYRSYQEIMDYARTFEAYARDANDEGYEVQISDVTSIDPCDIICDRGAGGNVYLCSEIGICSNLVNYEPCSEILLIRRLMQEKGTQILCRSNRQVKKILTQGIENVSTIHQAKGLEYNNVILIDFEIPNDEERNVAYVGMTRAKNNLMIIDFNVFLYVICSQKITTTKTLF